MPVNKRGAPWPDAPWPDDRSPDGWLRWELDMRAVFSEGLDDAGLAALAEWTARAEESIADAVMPDTRERVYAHAVPGGRELRVRGAYLLATALYAAACEHTARCEHLATDEEIVATPAVADVSCGLWVCDACRDAMLRGEPVIGLLPPIIVSRLDRCDLCDRVTEWFTPLRAELLSSVWVGALCSECLAFAASGGRA